MIFAKALAFSGTLGLAFASVGTRAQEIDGPAGGVAGYGSGDLLLEFFGASASADLVFDIGAPSAYTGLGSGTYSVAEFNGSATHGQPSTGSGNADYVSTFGSYSSSVDWT